MAEAVGRVESDLFFRGTSIRRENTAVRYHALFNGRTPDEMHFGLEPDLPQRLAELRAHAWAKRLAWNRFSACRVCSESEEPVAIQRHRTIDDVAA